MAKKVETRPASGMRDFLPDDVDRRQRVIRVIEEVYRSYGFLPLETPCLERIETLLGKYGEEGDQLVFKVLHRGQDLVDGIRQARSHLDSEGGIVRGRSGETAPGAEKMLTDMGMRYDLTVPLARVIAEHQGKLPMPFKRFQIQPVWRADSPGKGRFREFWQCDLDIVGAQTEVVECEVVSAASDVMEKLGFKEFDFLVNDRRILRAMVAKAGIPAELETVAIVGIDKLDKVAADAVTAELVQKGIEASAARALLELVGGRPTLDQLGERLAGVELAEPAIAGIRRLFELAKPASAGRHLVFDPSLARGLSYYTGNIFEIKVKDLAGSLGGGGRYDGLVGMFSGKEVPACGFSLGLERILVVMTERGMFGARGALYDVMLAAATDADIPLALDVARQLRGSGLRVDLNPLPTKPGKLRKTADDRGVAHAVWVEAAQIGAWSRATGAQAQHETFDSLRSSMRPAEPA